ncbi:3457_t:CDS:2, partial [Gigaspora rosea]
LPQGKWRPSDNLNSGIPVILIKKNANPAAFSSIALSTNLNCDRRFGRLVPTKALKKENKHDYLKDFSELRRVFGIHYLN